jgi:plasmid stabilization system protein ParE
LHEFLASRNPEAAARVVIALVDAADHLLDHPQIGERLGQFEPREIRRIIVGAYELRYEIVASHIYVLTLWYSRERR